MIFKHIGDVNQVLEKVRVKLERVQGLRVELSHLDLSSF